MGGACYTNGYFKKEKENVSFVLFIYLDSPLLSVSV